MAGGSFFAELRKRRVFRSAAIYGAIAWGLTEVIVTIVEQLFLPTWVATLSVIIFVVGFPVAMFLAWTFDITSGGIQRTEIGSRRGAMSIAGSVLLLIAGTAGLFLLIRPAMEQADHGQTNRALMPHSVAVLPFENASRREDDFYLSEGLGDELRDQLSRVPGIQIAARSSSIAVRNQAVGALKMATTLGVAYLVEGSLRRNGPRLSISVQLVDGSTGIAVWSHRYERGRLEMLEVQQDIAREVVALVLPDAPGPGVAGPATLNASANDLMLLARHKENEVRSRPEVDTERLLEAIGQYRQAVAIDPDSALIQVRLAGALLYLGDIEAARVSVFRALELDPGLSEVQNTLGEYHWALGDLAEAARAFEEAVELNPHSADALHNLAAVTMSTWAGMASGVDPGQLLRRARDNDRVSLPRHAALGEYLGLMGQWDDLPAVIEDIKARFDDTASYRAIAWLHELRGEIDLAIAWTLKARDAEPGNPDHPAKLSDLFALLGDAEMALRLQPSPSLSVLRHLRRHDELIDAGELLMIDRPDDIELRYLLSFSYVATGAFESAIHVLSSTGLPDTLLNDQARGRDQEGFTTLFNALDGLGRPDTAELARSLALWLEEMPWYGDIGWVAMHRACGRAILGRHDAVLALLPDIKKSPRLRDDAVLRDSWCFQPYANEPVYQEVLRDQAARRGALRERLPETLAEFGVAL